MNKTLILTALLLSSTSYANMYVKGGIGMYSGTDTFINPKDVGWNDLFTGGGGKDTKFDDQGIDFNVGLGFQITDSFSAELDLLKDNISMSYGLGLNLRLFKYNKLSIFTKAGISMIMYDDGILSNPSPINPPTLDDKEAIKLNLGFGVEYELNDSFSIYSSLDINEYSDITVRYNINTTGKAKVDNNAKMSVGVKYKF